MKRENRKYVIGDSEMGMSITYKGCHHEFYTEDGMTTTLFRYEEWTSILMTNEKRDYASLEIIEWNEYTHADMVKETTVNNVSTQNKKFWKMSAKRQVEWMDEYLINV